MEGILGNEELKEHFKTAIRNNKVSHAYILEGEKGSGKKKMAEAFARILQCEAAGKEAGKETGKQVGEQTRKQAGEPRACGTCRSCIMMDHRDHPDVIWVQHEKAGVISVGEIRDQLVNTIDIMPYKGPWKIYIVDEAEKLNPAAQNALLKSIEEPPEYAVILLLTTNRGAFLDTILSRCILLCMKPVADKLVYDYLRRQCKASESAAEFCTGFAMGNIGKAEAAAVSGDFAELTECGLSILRYLHELNDHEIISRARELKRWKDSIRDYLDIMLIWFRDILVLKAMDDPESLIFKREYPVLQTQSRLINYEDINRSIRDISHMGIRLGANVNFEASMEILHIEIKNRFKKNERVPARGIAGPGSGGRYG